MHLLRNAVQYYDWGSASVIPELLGIAPDGRPHAELWLGAHPQAPSALASTGRRLDELVAEDPVGQLGADVAARYGRFPFLLKVLAAARPLSLQAHPSADQAVAGFAREEAGGPARDAPDRLYRDNWPKPEIACAVTEFTALCGFRPVADSTPVLTALDRGEAARHDGSPGALLLSDVVRSLTDPPGDAGAAPDEGGRLAATVRALLSLDAADGAAVALAAVAAAGAARLDPATPPAVLAELDLLDEIAAAHPGDPGIVVALLLNHLRLAPGEALYIPAGVLHAYLAGTAVELMASSDNVLRGGLTTKHVDVAELMSVLDTTPAPPHRVVPVPVSAVETGYPAPAPQFRLSRLELRAAADGSAQLAELADPGGPQLLLCVAGAVRVTGARDTLRLGTGDGGFLPAGSGLVGVVVEDGASVLFRARVGDA